MSNNKRVLAIDGKPISINGEYIILDSTKLQDKTITPTTELQIVMADNQYIGLNSVTIESINITAQAIPSISIDNNGLITAESSQTAGYVAEGISTATKQLKIQTAQTIMPGITDKSINSGTYLTGIQTIKGDANLQAANIKEGTSIFGVEGTYKATDVTFTVADGNNAPLDPQNNVIWVQTDTEIPSYAILSSVERPSNPAEGMVWVVNGQTSSGAFDLTVDDNVVAIYPQKAYQYVNGEWTPRPIKVYKDGQWVDLFTATLNITYPVGALCSCTNGVVTYTAPDSTGIWELTVPSQGNWTVSAEGTPDWLIEPITVEAATNEEIFNINLVYFEATITITYPKGNLTVEHPITSYSHTGGGTVSFTVHQKGAYTAKAIVGSLTKTSTLNITTQNQTATATLSFKLYLFNQGDIASLTGGWNTSTGSKESGWGTQTATAGTTLYVYAGSYGSWNWGEAELTTKKAISFKGYSTLNFNVTATSGGEERLIGYGTSAWSTSTGNRTPTTGVNSLDISASNSSYYLTIYAYGLYASPSITVNQIWLDV